MVREAIIKPSELEGRDSKQRDLLLYERLGLSPSDLFRIRNNGDYYDRIVAATEELSGRGFNAEIKYSTLAAILCDEQDTIGQHHSGIYWIISKRFREEREWLEDKTGFTISWLHFLRDECGAYSGNLIEAHEVWENFQPSPFDWLRSVTIPPIITPDIAMLIGMYWGDGQMPDQPYFKLVGSKRDMGFYEAVVGPLVEQVHHIKQGVIPEDREIELDGVKYSYTYPVFCIGSKAIITWLIDDLGYCEGEKALPSIELNDDTKQGFLSGVFATKGSINWQRELFINDTDKTFIDSIFNLCEDLDYYPRLNKKRYDQTTNVSFQISIPPTGLRAIAEDCLLIHPRHVYDEPSIEARRSSYRIEQILNLIKEHQDSEGRGLKALEIAELLGLEKRGIFRYLAQMKEEGAVSLEDYVYFCSEQ